MNTSQINKTILLGWNSKLSASQLFGSHVFNAALISIVGFGYMMKDSAGYFSQMLAGFMLVLAGVSLLHGLVAYTKISRFSAKVSVNENHIHIKKKFFSSPVEIPWDQIKRIQMASYQIIFSLPGEDLDFSYRTTADTSVEIKSLIRKMAESKHIEVTGG